MVDISRWFESRRDRRKRIARNAAIATGAGIALAAGTWWAVRRYLDDSDEPQRQPRGQSSSGDGNRSPSRSAGTSRDPEVSATEAKAR